MGRVNVGIYIYIYIPVPWSVWDCLLAVTVTVTGNTIDPRYT